jgi:flagellar basal body P-ring formation protein FlgA
MPSRATRHRGLPAALLLLAVAGAAAAAEPEAPVSLRRQVVVDGATVALGDLFENAGARAAKVLGAAPAPGQQYLLEAQQLSIIARDNGLDWRPLSADQRVVVERPGRLLPREEVVEAVTAELLPLGLDPGLELELPGFSPPMLPVNARQPRLVLEGAAYDPASRRFGGTLLVLADGMAPLRQRLSGSAVALRPVVVAVRALRAGEPIGPEDVQVRRLRAERVRPGTADDPVAVVGSRARRALAAGQPVPLSDLVPSTLLRQGTPVLLQYEVPGLSLTAQGRALQDGAMGAVVTVMNLATGTVVAAEVRGPDRVRALGQAPAPESTRTAATRQR